MKYFFLYFLSSKKIKTIHSSWTIQNQAVGQNDPWPLFTDSLLTPVLDYQLHFHFLLSCVGEGNGNPLQRSWLENPRDGAAQSRTWLKWLSSISGSTGLCCYCGDLKMFASSFSKPLSILIPYTLMQSHLNSCPERICTRSFGILNQLFFLSPFHLSCPYSLSLPPQVFLVALLLWAHSMVLKGSISPHTKITSIWARVLSAHMLCLHLAHKLLFFFSHCKVTFLCAHLVPKFREGGNM